MYRYNPDGSLQFSGGPFVMLSAFLTVVFFPRDIACTAHATQMCLGGFCFFLLFNHMAYELLLHAVTGVSLAVALTAARALEDAGRWPGGRRPVAFRPAGAASAQQSRQAGPVRLSVFEPHKSVWPPHLPVRP